MRNRTTRTGLTSRRRRLQPARANLLIARPLLLFATTIEARSYLQSFDGVDELHQCRVCWMAESSQLPPLARMNVHNSVTSVRSPPSTVRLLARSTMLSLSAYFIATVA